jgi:hypothetical protein
MDFQPQWILFTSPSLISESFGGQESMDFHPTYPTWLVVEPIPLKKKTKVSWDDDIPNMMGKIIQMFQTTNQI